MPPEPVFSEVQKLKEEMSVRYLTRQARYSPPHITLHMPFEFREDREEELRATLCRAVSGQGTFALTLDGFGAFPPRVIFIRPLTSSALDTLYALLGKTMRTKLKILTQDAYSRPFHPHLTIAFRDLRGEFFNSAWEEFKKREYLATFSCEHVWILKKQGQYWVQHLQIPFKEDHE